MVTMLEVPVESLQNWNKIMVEKTFSRNLKHVHVAQCYIHGKRHCNTVADVLPFNLQGGNSTTTKHQIFAYWLTVIKFSWIVKSFKSRLAPFSLDNIEDNLKRWVFAVSATIKLPYLVILYMTKCTRLQYSLVKPVCKPKIYGLTIFPCQTSLYSHLSGVSCWINPCWYRS